MALVKVNTTQTGDLAAPLTTPVIVDMDFPINPSNFTHAGGVGTNHTTVDIACTDLPGASTDIQMDFGHASGVVADRITQDQIVENLNNLMEKAVADPYAIPDFSQASREAGYLEPETVFTVEDIQFV